MWTRKPRAAWRARRTNSRTKRKRRRPPVETRWRENRSMRGGGSWLRSTRREFLIRATAAGAFCAAAEENEPVRVIPVPDNGIQPQVAVAGAGLQLAYFAGDPKHGDVFYVRSDDFGRTFSSRLRVNSQEGSAIAIGSIRGAQIALGKQNRVHVAWNGSDTGQPRSWRARVTDALRPAERPGKRIRDTAKSHSGDFRPGWRRIGGGRSQWKCLRRMAR